MEGHYKDGDEQTIESRNEVSFSPILTIAKKDGVSFREEENAVLANDV